MKIFLGKDIETEDPIHLDFEGARAILVCGKRGSGKSYTLGVFVEELLAAGQSDIIPILIDPMGIYHTMTQPNTAQQDELFKWGLSIKAYNVRLLIPGEPQSLYDPDVLEVLQDRGTTIAPLHLNASDLSPDGWCDLFDANINRPLGITLFRAVQHLREKKGFFIIPDIIKEIERDGKAADASKEALFNRLEAARLWHLFSEEEYVPLQELFAPGKVNVLDLSRLDPGAKGLRNLTVSIIARHLFHARLDARLREEFGLATPLPKVWILIDEAHQFVPNGNTTLSKPQLIRWAKEGRQPGLSLVVASQQPSAIDPDVLSQCDIILSHKVTAYTDIRALNNLSQDYMGNELRTYIKTLQRTGEAVLVDDKQEAVRMLRIRPRRSQHGGGTTPAKEEETFDIWNL